MTDLLVSLIKIKDRWAKRARGICGRCLLRSSGHSLRQFSIKLRQQHDAILIAAG